ncbi:hypothetical protein [Streptomyces sp. NPDC056255]|uniref:hypothetical protein n=1 Tax=Streptomyces sp. NPDC056255 TaxID=3345764 RepID=UPI0035E2D148
MAPHSRVGVTPKKGNLRLKLFDGDGEEWGTLASRVDPTGFDGRTRVTFEPQRLARMTWSGKGDGRLTHPLRRLVLVFSPDDKQSPDPLVLDVDRVEVVGDGGPVACWSPAGALELTSGADRSSSTVAQAARPDGRRPGPVPRCAAARRVLRQRHRRLLRRGRGRRRPGRRRRGQDRIHRARDLTGADIDRELEGRPIAHLVTDADGSVWLAAGPGGATGWVTVRAVVTRDGIPAYSGVQLVKLTDG